MSEFGFNDNAVIMAKDKLRINTQAVVDRYQLHDAENTLLGFQNCWHTRLWAERLLIIKAAMHLYSLLPYNPDDAGRVDFSAYKIATYKALYAIYSKKLKKKLEPKNGLFGSRSTEINQFDPLMAQFDAEIKARITPLESPPEKPTDYIKL